MVCTKYILQYVLGAAATGGIVPLLNAIGIGWSLTICMLSPPLLTTVSTCDAHAINTVTVTLLDVIGGVLIVYIARYLPDKDV